MGTLSNLPIFYSTRRRHGHGHKRLRPMPSAAAHSQAAHPSPNATGIVDIWQRTLARQCKKLPMSGFVRFRKAKDSLRNVVMDSATSPQRCRFLESPFFFLKGIGEREVDTRILQGKQVKPELMEPDLTLSIPFEVSKRLARKQMKVEFSARSEKPELMEPATTLNVPSETMFSARSEKPDKPDGQPEATLDFITVEIQDDSKVGGSGDGTLDGRCIDTLWRGARGRVLLTVYALIFGLAYIPIFFATAPPAGSVCKLPPGITNRGNQSVQEAGMTRTLTVMLDAPGITKERAKSTILSRFSANNLKMAIMSINIDGVASVSIKTTQTLEDVRSCLQPGGVVYSEAQVVEVLEIGRMEDTESNCTWMKEAEIATEECTTRTGSFCHSNTTIRVRTLGRGGGEYERMSLQYEACLRMGADCNEPNQREIFLKRDVHGNIVEACGDDIHSDDSKYVTEHFSNVNRISSMPCLSDTQEEMCDYQYEVDISGSKSEKSSILQLTVRNKTNKAHVRSVMNFEPVSQQYQIINQTRLVEAEVQQFHSQCAEMRRQGNCVRVQHDEFFVSQKTELKQRKRDPELIAFKERELMAFKDVFKRNRITEAEDYQQLKLEEATRTKNKTLTQNASIGSLRDTMTRMKSSPPKMDRRQPGDGSSLPLRRLSFAPNANLVEPSVSLEFNDDKVLRAIFEDAMLVKCRTELSWPRIMMLQEGNPSQRVRYGLTKDPILQATIKAPATIRIDVEFSARVDFRHRQKICAVVCITDDITADMTFRARLSILLSRGTDYCKFSRRT